MFSYMNIGRYGQLGNQMFQYAALYGLGFIRGAKIRIPSNGHYLLNAFPNISAVIDDTPHTGPIYQEPSFGFSPDLLMISDGMDLLGFFQSANYFLHCEDQILKEFTFNNNVQRRADDIFRQVGAEITCSVHFRRKDYLKSMNYHYNQDSSYYNQAINLILKKYPMAKFLVFSDDLEWCKQTLPQEMIVIDTTAEGEDSKFIDMCVMSKCKTHIIANSSFSWWGAFLSRSAGVIAPKKWFGLRGPKYWQSVYAPGWVTL